MPSQDRQQIAGEIMRIAAILLALAALGSATEAAAQQRRPGPPGFRVCNQTASEIEVAKAVNTGATDAGQRIIISEGWYKLPPGACTQLWPAPLNYLSYLVYAQDKVTGRQWSGTVPLCVSGQAFTIRSDTCGSGYDRRLFNQVNMGNERTSWTHVFHP